MSCDLRAFAFRVSKEAAVDHNTERLLLNRRDYLAARVTVSSPELQLLDKFLTSQSETGKRTNVFLQSE